MARNTVRRPVGPSPVKGAQQPKETLPFMQGRVFELILCLVTLAVVIAALLQVPLTTDAYEDRLTPVMFIVFGSVGLAAAVMIRHGLLVSYKLPRTHPKYGDFFYRWYFIWLLPCAVFVVLLPWIIAGVFNSPEINTFGSAFLFLLILWTAVGLGLLAAAIVWYPIELMIRSVFKYIRSRGKEGVGGMILATYLLLVVAFTFVGTMAASADIPGRLGYGSLVAALLGLPGAYELKSEFYLWIARGLGLVMIGAPFVFHWVAKKHKDSKVVNDITRTLG